MLLALAGALALRAPRLATRPFHNDEGVNAIKATELWQHGRYAYDPDEYHGPTLHYATLPFLWLSGARNPGEVRDATLRLAPVVFGVGLILLLLLFVDGLGRHAVVWSALLTAVLPRWFSTAATSFMRCSCCFHGAYYRGRLALFTNALDALGGDFRGCSRVNVCDQGNIRPRRRRDGIGGNSHGLVDATIIEWRSA